MSLRLPTGFSLYAFDDLGVALLYTILALRQRVFVVEQRCIFLDTDGRDAHALHLVHTPDGGDGVDAYARLFLPGPTTPYASIGRVITAPEVRGTGLGHRLVDVALDALHTLAPAAPVHISAQAHLDRWYQRHGFVAVGEPYLEDDIPHLNMTRAPRP